MLGSRLNCGGRYKDVIFIWHSRLQRSALTTKEYDEEVTAILIESILKAIPL
jgi:hypothetical protein